MEVQCNSTVMYRDCLVTTQDHMHMEMCHLPQHERPQPAVSKYMHGPYKHAVQNQGARLCGRTRSSGGSCDSVTYSTFGVNYSRVCGRVIGYQSRVPDAFDYPSQTIKGYYVDGISLTHGPPGSRQHIWTFAAAWDRGKQSIHLSNPLLSMC